MLGAPLKKIETVLEIAIIVTVWLGFGRDQDAVNETMETEGAEIYQISQ
jgi:hypothetical protein